MTLAEFKLKYPTITASDEVIQQYLDLFLCIYTDDYGCMSDYLQGLFTAHKSYISTRPASAIVVNTSKRVGDVSVGGSMVGGSSANYQDFSASRYGNEFVSMIAPFGAGPMMAGEFYG